MPFLAISIGSILATTMSVGTDASASLQDPSDDPITRAWHDYRKLEPATQRTILEAIEARISSDPDPALQFLLQLRTRAQKELEIASADEPSFHSPATYAPGPFRRGEAKRSFAPPESDANAYYEQRFQVAASWPPFPLAVSYDFGRNRGLRWRAALPDADRLWMLLWGHAPDTDLLHAWLCSQWDFAKPFDASAEHFRRAYCDLEGTAYAGVQLYHAFASTLPIDMPDVDVIAFARAVKRDRSFVSPIPAGKKREQLYETIRAHFLEYFQHRTWIEAAATIYLDPDGRLREEHEGLRGRLLFDFAKHEGDPAKLERSFKSAGDREKWIQSIDRALAPGGGDPLIAAERQARLNRRARIIEHTHAVLREYELLAPATRR